MATLDERIAKAVEGRMVPGVVMMARDRTGALNYSKSFGTLGLDPSSASSTTALAPESVFVWMSLTKLPTTIAVLQQVERGHLSLDEDLSETLPELASQPVLAGGASPDDGTLTLKAGDAERKLTLRRLLSHSSGLAYPFLPGPLLEYFGATKRSPVEGATVQERYAFPLLFEPGEGWAYGVGVDWAGLLLERATGLSLEAYLRDFVYGPLGLSGADVPTFFPWEGVVPDDRKVSVASRNPSTNKVGPGPAPPPPPPPSAPKVSFGGEAASGSVDAFARVLNSLLLDNGVLLKPETAALLFQPQLGGSGSGTAASTALLRELEHPEWIAGVVPKTGEYDWAFGGLLVDGDSHPQRKKGCVMWGGMYNSSWFLDREAGLFGIFATQMVPPGDPLVRELTEAFQQDMYSRVARVNS